MDNREFYQNLMMNKIRSLNCKGKVKIMAKKYKVFQHSKCKQIIELEVSKNHYVGFCKFCNMKLKVKK